MEIQQEKNDTPDGKENNNLPERENQSLTTAEEQLPDEVVKRLPQLLEVLKGSGVITNSSMKWSGPLPPQVVNKITPEKAGHLVDDFIRHHEAKDRLEEKMLEKMAEDNKDERKHKKNILIISLLFILIVFGSCLCFNKLDFIEDMVPLLALFIGGLGGGVIILNKKVEKKEDKIDIE